MEEKLTDEQYIAAYREGRLSQIDPLMDRYKNMVRAKASSMYILGGDEQDLIQEGMIGLFKAVRDYDFGRDASFATFADLCVSRQIYNAIQASGRLKNLPLNDYVSLTADSESDDGAPFPDLINALAGESSAEPETAVLSQETVDEINELIETRLTSSERDVFRLHVTGLATSAIAAILSMEPKSADNALQRARAKLRRAIGSMMIAILCLGIFLTGCSGQSVETDIVEKEPIPAVSEYQTPYDTNELDDPAPVQVQITDTIENTEEEQEPETEPEADTAEESEDPVDNTDNVSEPGYEVDQADIETDADEEAKSNEAVDSVEVSPPSQMTDIDLSYLRNVEYTQEELNRIAQFYSSSVFAGDSVLVGFRNYSERSDDPMLTGMTFLASGSYSLHNAFWDVGRRSVHPLWQGEQHQLWESIPMTGAKRLFLFFGINDVDMGVEASLKLYPQLVDRIRETSPGIEVTVLTPTYTLKDMGKGGINNTNIAAFNEGLKQLAAEQGWGYIDLATPLSDGAGNLAPQYCADGRLHQGGKAYEVWTLVLRAYAAERLGIEGTVSAPDDGTEQE